MKNFENLLMNEINYRAVERKGNVIKSKDVIPGTDVKFDVEENSSEGVKIILKKDANDNIKEIKFVCSCGETKSVILDYSE